MGFTLPPELEREILSRCDRINGVPIGEHYPKGEPVKITIPLKLPSLANCRLHWRAMAKLKQGQKEIVSGLMYLQKKCPLPVVVTLTRVGKRKMDDDNLAHAFKAIRDGIAESYGVDDGSNLYRWRYEQRKGKEYAIEIEIQPSVRLGE